MNEPVEILESELLARLKDEETADETLATYFEPFELSSTLVLKENVTIIPDVSATGPPGMEFGLQQHIIALANRIFGARRRKRYRRVKAAHPELPRAVAEGDSWFQHPQIEDVIDHLFNNHNPRLAVLCFGGAGDDLALMAQQNSYRQAVADEKPRFLFLSGGGNDILGTEFPNYLNDPTPGTPGEHPERFLNEDFDRKMAHLKDVYTLILEDMKRDAPDVHVVVHGYDYVRPGVDKPDKDQNEHKGKWLGIHLTGKGIDDPEDRVAIVRTMVDRFNAVLEELGREHDNLIYVDVRDSVGGHEWNDEIHPNDRGFNAVATKILNTITPHLA